MFSRLSRCGLVVLATTIAALVALRLLAPVALAPATDFDTILVRGCAAVACACTLWGWLSAVAVVFEALSCIGGQAPRANRSTTPAVPLVLRRLVLAACGVALSAGAAAPALAAPGSQTSPSLATVVGELPYPARAMDLPSQSPRTVVVHAGDSLWAIAERRLSTQASDAEITAGWREVYARNRAVVGDDPSLIHPGQRLTLPDDLEETS